MPRATDAMTGSSVLLGGGFFWGGGGPSIRMGPPPPLYRTCSYYRCWTPGPVTMARLLLAVAQARWRIEEDHQLASRSRTGLGQVIRWRSWHHGAPCACRLTYLGRRLVALDRDARAGLEIGLIRHNPESAKAERHVIPRPTPTAPHRQH